MHISRRKHERSRRRRTEEDEAAGVPILLARSVRLGGLAGRPVWATINLTTCGCTSVEEHASFNAASRPPCHPVFRDHQDGGLSLHVIVGETSVWIPAVQSSYTLP
jgi:hypothetical protein